MNATIPSPAAAPGRLEIVRRFVNTLDVEDATDALATPESLRVWVRGAGLGDVSVDEDALRRTQALRAALRLAMRANHDSNPLPSQALAVVNEAAARAGLHLTLGADSSWTAAPSAEGIEGAMGELLVLVWSAMTGGAWRRLKICRNDACQWAFYDHSRARSGKWCSMQVCGNRIKQQTWRARHDRSSAHG